MSRHLRPLAALIALTGAAQAGGWTQPEGAYYAKVWGRLLKGGKGYLANGESAELFLRPPGGEAVEAPFLDTSLNVYAEYGLLDGTTLLASAVPYGRAKVEDEVAHYVGPIGLVVVRPRPRVSRVAVRAARRGRGAGQRRRGAAPLRDRAPRRTLMTAEDCG
jgi:hypothetical protein